MDSREMARIAVKALEDKKGEDIRIIDISKVSVLADYFIIANGSNTNQVQALVDNVQEELFQAGVEAKQVEGYNTASWILMDFGDIIVHVFSQEDRLFYDLERIWRDGEFISTQDIQETADIRELRFHFVIPDRNREDAHEEITCGC